MAGSVEGERGQRYSVPGSCLALCVGPHCSPGYLRDAIWITSQGVQPFPMPFWAKPVTHVGLLFITAILECVRVPTPAQLCSAGCAGGFSMTAFHARFIALRVSRSHGACASSWHQGERNRTSTASKLSKTWRPRPLIPGG